MPLSKAEQRAAIEQAWQRGRLRYKLKPIQLRMAQEWEAGKIRSRKHVLHVSRRVGKSTFLFILAVEKCLEKAGARVGFVAPVERRLEDYIRAISTKVLMDCPEGLRPEELAHKNIYRFKNGSEIVFAGSNNQSYNSLRGLEFDHFFVDEAAFVDNLSELVDEVALPTLFHTHGFLILSSTSPVTPDHPFKRYCEQAVLSGTYSKHTIEDDETLDRKEVDLLIAEMGGREASRTRRELFCEFTVDEERALTPSWSDTLVQDIARDEYFQFYHLYEAMDLGFKRDFTCIGFAHFDYIHQKVVLEDEIVIKGPKLASKNLAEMIKAKEKDLWRVGDPDAPKRELYKRVSDNDDLIFLNTLSVEQGIHFSPTSKDSLHEMIDRLNNYLREGKLLVHPRCKYTIQCLRTGIWDKDRKKLERSDVLGHYDGTMMLAYLLQNLDTWSNPVPTSFKRHPDARVFRDEPLDGQQDTAQVRKLFRDYQEEII